MALSGGIDYFRCLLGFNVQVPHMKNQALENLFFRLTRPIDNHFVHIIILYRPVSLVLPDDTIYIDRG